MFYRIVITSIGYLGITFFSFNSHALTIEEATYDSIGHSPEVKEALALYREKKEDADVARRTSYYPSIDLDASIGREITYADASSSEDVSLTRREVTFSLDQPIFDGFSTQNEIKRLDSEAEADRWHALIAVENTALETAEVFADMLRYRELVSLADLNLQTHQRIYNQIKLKTDSGIGRKSDLSQISARLSKAYANHFIAVNNLRDAESNYKHITGKLPPDDLIYPISDKDLLPVDLTSAINQALKTNPAIEGSYWDIIATESLQAVTDADQYPTLNFVVERTFDNNLDGVEDSSEDLTAMLELSYNIYSGGSFKHKQEAAVQQNIQATEIRLNTIRDTELTVRLAWASYESTTGQKEHLKEYVIATKESQVAYEKQFRLGRRTLLDVLDSENELFQARQDYVNADYDKLFSEFRLLNAKGDLMRAFRMYRPKLLGFNDKFDKKIATEHQSSISQLEKIEPAPIDTQTNEQEINTINLESELFLESSESTGNWSQ